MTVAVALDTSGAIPLLVATHRAHAAVTAWWGSRVVALSSHLLAETCSVLTRLPDDLRVAPRDAARLIADRFAPPLLLPDEDRAGLPDVLAAAGIAGGAVYDALVGLAAARHDVPLASRDARARGTYEAVGARVVLAG